MKNFKQNPNAYGDTNPRRATIAVAMSKPFLTSSLDRVQSKYARGFLLPAAIFLLVILGGLGAYAINLSTTQNATSLQDVQGARAYQIARAGVEWAAYQALAPATANLGSCPTSPSTLSIDGLSVTVTCTRSADYFEQGSDHTIAMYNIVSTASFGAAGSANYVERQIQVTLSKCRGTDAATPYQCG
jgi:MSHA biogenesis protein MshP